MFGYGSYFIILLITNFFTFMFCYSTENIKKTIENDIINDNEINKTKTIMQKLNNRINKQKIIINELKSHIDNNNGGKFLQHGYLTNEYLTNEYLDDIKHKLTTTELDCDQLSEIKTFVTNEMNICDDQIKNRLNKLNDVLCLVYKLTNNIAYIDNGKITYCPEYKVYFECFGFPENIDDMINIDNNQLNMIKHEIEMKINMFTSKKN